MISAMTSDSLMVSPPSCRSTKIHRLISSSRSCTPPPLPLSCSTFGKGSPGESLHLLHAAGPEQPLQQLSPRCQHVH